MSDTEDQRKDPQTKLELDNLDFPYTKLEDPSKFRPSQVVVAQTASVRLCTHSFIFGAS